MQTTPRIKEEYERGATTQEAIAKGVKGTAGVITNAAPSWLNWTPSISMSEGESGMMKVEGDRSANAG